MSPSSAQKPELMQSEENRRLHNAKNNFKATEKSEVGTDGTLIGGK